MIKLIKGYENFLEVESKYHIDKIYINRETWEFIPTTDVNENIRDIREYGFVATLPSTPVYEDNTLNINEFKIEYKEY